MDFLDANLQLLSRRQPELARLLASSGGGPVDVFASASGVPTARYAGSSSVVLLHSRYDPLKEARDSLSKQDLSGDGCFVLLGFGLGYLLDALIERQDGMACGYFVVESDPRILRAAFEARDLRTILSLPQLHFAWPASGQDLRDQWQRFFDPVKAERCTFLTHAPAVALQPGLFRSAIDIIQSGTFQILTDINTLVNRSHEFLRNFCRNVGVALLSPGVAGFAGKFAGVPAVIVSAGPSLDKNIHELRGSEDRVLLLSTDTALKPLLAAGIEPHFVLTADPGHRNFLHLQGCETRRALLVAEVTAYPDALREFPGRTVSCMFQDSSLRALSPILEGKGSLKAWGSVATMALDFALLLGCDPVIFVGQDLAHSDGRTYCTGLYTEKEWFAGVEGPEEWAERWKRLKEGHKIVVMEDVFGRPVETTDKLTAYWNWMVKEIEAHPRTRFINATEGGILRQGVEIVSLRDALHRHGSSDLGLRRRSREVYALVRQEGSGGSDDAAGRLEEESLRLDVVLKAGVEAARAAAPGSSRELFGMLEKAKERIYREAPQLASLLDSFNQMGNVAFLRARGRFSRLPEPPEAGIRRAYEEYFASVRAALDGVLPSLKEIRLAIRELDPPHSRPAG